jgi:hypothetical protein
MVILAESRATAGDHGQNGVTNTEVQEGTRAQIADPIVVSATRKATARLICVVGA